jgi:hypothetical protein
MAQEQGKMTADYSNVADDYYFNTCLQTTLALPKNRETVLHFFDAAQKQFPQMASLYQRDRNVFALEGDRESGSYPWLEIESHRVTCGYFNPPDPQAGQRLAEWVLDRVVPYLGVSPLDVDTLDVLMGFNIDYRGNRDAIVAQALLSGSPLGAFVGEGPGRAIELEPSVVIGIDEECFLQARLSVETRTNAFQIRTGSYDDEPIGVYLTVRQYPRPAKLFDLADALPTQRDICENLVERLVIPQVIQPICAAIAGAQ